MSCLALSLQPVNGSDILLQTREWFPPARALIASFKFRVTREAYTGSSSSKRGGTAVAADSMTDAERLGDDALAASGGQVVVGKESKFRVFYRLVNSIYVLGITSIDQDGAAVNFFECTAIVNQAVSVLVAACKGVDVTPDKIQRKYTEIYMALDVVLRGVTWARLATILATIHGEGIPHMVLSATDAENRARGAESWNQVKGQAIEQLANVDVLSAATFEMPEETLAAGDEIIATLATATQSSISESSQQVVEEKPAEVKDPFAVSDQINKPEELAGGFKRSKDPSDLTAVLADLEVPKVAASATANSTFIGVQGFEGEYGGLDFGEESAAFGGAFEGIDDAFGGGLDASEFGAVIENTSQKGLGGLEELERGGKSEAPKAIAESPLVKEKALAESGKPVLYLSEEVYAHFKGSKLYRLGVQGSLYVKYTSGQDSSFAFRLDGCAGIRRALLRSTSTSSLGNNRFHARVSPAEEPLVLLKYRLHPRFTPLPLRLRLVTRLSGSLISFMIQYVVNHFLPAPLREVTFIVSLPFVPSLLKLSPKGSLNRHSKEIRWHVQEIPLQSSPGCLRAQMPLESDGNSANGGEKPSKKIMLEARVQFTHTGQSLSGIAIAPATEGNTDFSVGIHTYKAGTYICA